ncbi:MAG: hypothetical protein M3041_00985 [Acidobacteriota bacterium]|nr:hypothetical protein [Acidobacteriota bacterium]
MPRPLPWRTIAIITTATTILLSLLLLPACCCVRGPVAPVTAPHSTIPLIGTEPIPTPTEAQSQAPTQAAMRNVDFHVDETTILKIHQLRGEMIPKQPGTPLNFDDKTSFVLKVDRAKIGLTSAGLDGLMNAYVFNAPNSPLKNLHVSPDGKQLKQEGIVHKIIDIPFTMWADVSADNGRIRIHPTKMSICGLNGLGLLKAVGMTLEKMIGKELPHDHGVAADRNDLLLDPAKMLPPPDTELHLVEVHIEGDELMQTFDAGRHLPDLPNPHPNERNYMHYRGGTLRMGKLLFVDADMFVADADPSDPFDFFIDRYNDELVAGFSRNQPNYALFVFMRDFNDLGKPPKPGERLAP